MADFPTSIYNPRTKQNKAGVIYKPLIPTTLFAEDISLLDAEVVAIENFLSPVGAGVLLLDQTSPQTVSGGVPIFDSGINSNGDININNSDLNVNISTFFVTSCPLSYSGNDYTYGPAGEGSIFLLDKATFELVDVLKSNEPAIVNCNGIDDYGVALCNIDIGGGPGPYIYLTFYFKNSDFVGGVNPNPGTADNDYVDTWFSAIIGLVLVCDYFVKSIWTAGATSTDDYVWANPGSLSLVAGYTTPPTLEYSSAKILNTSDISGNITVRRIVETYPTYLKLDQNDRQVFAGFYGVGFLCLDSDYKMYIDNNDYITGGEVHSHESDTLGDVISRLASTTQLPEFQNEVGIVLGKLDTANIAGSIQFKSAGTIAANGYFTTITAGTQTGYINYTLPNTTQDGLLRLTGGQLSWDNTAYVSGTPWTGLYVRLNGESSNIINGSFNLNTSGDITTTANMNMKKINGVYTSNIDYSTVNAYDTAYTLTPTFSSGFSDGGGYIAQKLNTDFHLYRTGSPNITAINGTEYLVNQYNRITNSASYSGTQNYGIENIGLLGALLLTESWNGTGKQFDVNNEAGRFLVNSQENLIAGTMNLYNIGVNINIEENSNATAVTNVLFSLDGQSTHTNNYAVKDNSQFDFAWALMKDNKELRFGAGQDTAIYYDGTNLVINPRVVGTGTINIPHFAGGGNRPVMVDNNGNLYV